MMLSAESLPVKSEPCPSPALPFEPKPAPTLPKPLSFTMRYGSPSFSADASTGDELIFLLLFLFVRFHHCQALNTKDWTDGEPTESEKDFWEIAAMEAYGHLTDWKSLQYCSTFYIDENSPANLDNMWLEPLYQVSQINEILRSRRSHSHSGASEADSPSVRTLFICF